MKIIKSLEEIIIHEDDNFIVINKPSGISSLDERNINNPSILRLAKKHHEDIQVAHRLDKETTGCLILTKNNESYKYIAQQFESRNVKKLYHAFCEGKENYNDLELFTGIVYKNNGTVIATENGGKPSATLVNTIEHYKYHSLYECFPITGRLHQIRAQMAFIGHPLIGDITYGGRDFYLSQVKRNYKGREDEKPIIKRVALHANSIQFIDQKSNLVSVSAQYPKDLEVLKKQLTKHK